MSETVTPAWKKPVTLINPPNGWLVGTVPLVATLDPRLLAPRERGLELVRADDLGGLWSLRLPLAYPRTRSVNVFLLDRHTLLDCGSAVGLGLDGARARAADWPARGCEDIRTLVLSHLHADHASLAGEFVERTGCELLRFEGPDTNIDRAARADDRPRRACRASLGRTACRSTRSR